MATKTDVLNIALARIGVSKRVQNIDTERSIYAETARTLIDEDIKYVLRDFPWPFATAYVDLALVDGSTTENAVSDWRYSYRYPSDCLYARRIVVATVGRNNPAPPPFRIGRDSQGKLIYTNEPEAELEYTYAITEVSEFDAIAVSQLAWKLGAGISPSLSRVKGIAEVCMAMYEVDKAKAQSRSLNEGQQDDPIEAEAIRARE